MQLLLLSDVHSAPMALVVSYIPNIDDRCVIIITHIHIREIHKDPSNHIVSWLKYGQLRYI